MCKKKPFSMGFLFSSQGAVLPSFLLLMKWTGQLDQKLDLVTTAMMMMMIVIIMHYLKKIQWFFSSQLLSFSRNSWCKHLFK